MQLFNYFYSFLIAWMNIIPHLVLSSKTIIPVKSFLALLCLCFGLQSNSQNLKDSIQYKVTYQLTYHPDSTNLQLKKSEIMWLLSGDKGSLFLSEPRAFKDSLSRNSNLAALGSPDWKKKVAKTKSDFNYKIFKDREHKKLHHSLKILDDKLFYTEPLSLQKWQIENESRTISGYMAQKATTSYAGRNYTAWFTPEIPISDGPYKFSGLPGLILEIEDAAGEYAFKFEGFQKLETIAVQIVPEDFQQTTKKEFKNIQKRYEADPINYVNNYVGKGGKTIQIKMKGGEKKNYIKKRKEKLAANNNPIELE